MVNTVFTVVSVSGTGLCLPGCVPGWWHYRQVARWWQSTGLCTDLWKQRPACIKGVVGGEMGRKRCYLRLKEHAEKECMWGKE